MTTPAFKNRAGCELILETWVSLAPGHSATQMTPVNRGETVPLPASITDEWIVYVAPFTRIGKLRREPAADGARAWTDGPFEFGVGYVPKKSGRAAHYVAWATPCP